MLSLCISLKLEIIYTNISFAMLFLRLFVHAGLATAVCGWKCKSLSHTKISLNIIVFLFILR